MTALAHLPVATALVRTIQRSGKRVPWWRRLRWWLWPRPLQPDPIASRLLALRDSLGRLDLQALWVPPRRRYERPFAYRAVELPPDRVPIAVRIIEDGLDAGPPILVSR